MKIWTITHRRRWIGWGLLAASFLLVSFHRNATAVLSEELVDTFTTTGAQLGLLHASFFYIYAALQLPSGFIVDWLGTRKVGALGTAVMGIGAIGFGLSETYLLAVVSRALMGFGGSVMYIAALRFAVSWYRPDEFATMSGMTLAVLSLGALLATTPLAVAVTTVGWRPTHIVIGLFSFTLAAGIYLASHSTPTKAGLSPVEGAIESRPQTLRALREDTKKIFRDADIWLIGIYLFFILGVSITLFGLWAIPYLTQVYTLSVTSASLYLLVPSFGALFGGPVLGWLSDRLGRRSEILVVGSLLLTLAFGVIAAIGSPPLLVVGALFLFIRVISGIIALTYTIVKERHPESSGIAIGAVNSLGFIGAAIFPGLIGAVLDAFSTGEAVDGTRIYTTLGYRIAFAIAAMSMLIGTCCVIMVYIRERRTESQSADDDLSVASSAPQE
ncbi:MFS transporter [Natrinema sp. CBA1119]|uniref:MFS transporter n=1 Tax=Natrinema sp. CBA1119 TaxID=1608465 RepID=UPI000BF5F597|nr:MFS transporter [Natrinema sp. CBA1119]PGF14578.1 MFS transporter [Natrinema sp. CBA1119]